MASLNKVQLIGNLGKDPETRYAPSGDAICNMTIATSESWKDKATGEKKEQTEWHRVVMFQKLAEIAAQYLHKGSSVYIEGRLQTRKWADKDGTDRYTTEIRADQMKMLGGKSDGASAPQEPSEQRKQTEKPAQQSSGGGFGDFDSEVPFRQLGAGSVWRVI